MRASQALICLVVAVIQFGCAGPTGPKPPESVSGLPVVQSISVPTSRVEAGQDIVLTAAVLAGNTPLSELSYEWLATAGTIVGNGTSAVWRMPPGITAGVDVRVTLKVTDQPYVVTKTSAAFRVHDSIAETRELARKFLVDLFGDSSVPAEDCMVDFADVCASLPEGREEELVQIQRHRQQVIVYSSMVLHQRVQWREADFGSVHTAFLVNDRVLGDPPKPPTCGDFEVSVIYVDGRWWICQSFFNEDDTSYCPASLDNRAMAEIMGGGDDGGSKGGTIRR